jgi:penicillin amidase
MAYLSAQNNDDLFFAQGFVTAQDRLFPMELTRLMASGRISELAGERAKGLDIRHRTYGFRRAAEKHAQILTGPAKSFLERYAQGVNAFIEHRPQEIPLEFKLSGLKPEPWTSVDCLAILYFMGWNSAANLGSEVVAQMLVEKLGPQKAAELFPININPALENQTGVARTSSSVTSAWLGLDPSAELARWLKNETLALGSNNWATGPGLSAGGKPIVANDPHLDARILPGPWYPCGLMTPEFRAVGVTIPGVPGMTIGRTDHIALGVTNAYGDTQDLYVETPDPQKPDHYLEGTVSKPFEIVEERLKIREKGAPGGFKEETIRIRLTRRGPVVSDVLPGYKADKVLSLRWSAVEAQSPSLGFERLLTAKNVAQIREALQDVNQISLNFVFADMDGQIGWQVSGKLPIRTQGDSQTPYPVRDDKDNWTGFVPYDRMPHALNPAEGWLGTCNHDTIGPDFPYYYSTHLSPSFRQRRLMALMNAPGKKSADAHWAYQRDTLNVMAENIAPLMAKALAAHPDTKAMGDALAAWNHLDDPNQVGPTLFQAVYREFALAVYKDELGESLAGLMLDNWYFWQERLQRAVLTNDSPWFDDVTTPAAKETRDLLFHQAALRAAEGLKAKLGSDQAGWTWGKAHRHEFVNPIRRSGPGKEWLGGDFAAPGSGETLYRGLYDFGNPYGVVVSASLRMVADLADPEKVVAVLPGGVSGRVFDPHAKDQLDAFMSGEKRYWWFSEAAVEGHSKSRMTLEPGF